MSNHNHNGYAYAVSRYAREFLDGVAEHKFSKQMLGVANRRVDPDWDQSRAMKCLNATKRKRDLAKKRLDRYRRLLKLSGEYDHV